MSAVASTSAPARALELKEHWPVPVIVAFGVVSVIVLGGSVAAAFPPGDGGLFAEICAEIVDGRFQFPRVIAYNGLHIPFSYSPLAFYAVASLSQLLHISVPRAMQWWVMCWTFAFAPAAYYAARCILRDRAQAVVAAAFLVVLPMNSAWLGMGGGMTRAPGFVCYMVAAGAAWAALRDGGRRRTLLAALAAGAIAWFHMEFFFLYAVTLVLLTVAFRRRFAAAAAIAAGAGVLALPWVLLAHHDMASFQNALQTRHFAHAAVPLTEYLHYVGIGLPGEWLALLALASLAVALARGRYVFALWFAAVIAVDSRAGIQGAHLPAALAIGFAFGSLRDAFPRPAHRNRLLYAAIGAALVGAVTVFHMSAQYVRTSETDIAAWRWIGAHTERDAAIFTLSPRSLSEPALDQSFEWLPVYAQRVSPITYQGLEWLDGRSFAFHASAFYGFQELCVRRGPECVLVYARDLAPGRPRYVYIPRHGIDYELVSARFRTDPRLRLTHEDNGGALFRLPVR
jgi:hypothetical protein